MQEGKIQPTMAYRQLPLLTAPPAQCTMKAPMAEVIESLHALETERGVVTATLSMGFPFADIADAGVSILVTTNNDMSTRGNLRRPIRVRHLGDARSVHVQPTYRRIRD